MNTWSKIDIIIAFYISGGWRIPGYTYDVIMLYHVHIHAELQKKNTDTCLSWNEFCFAQSDSCDTLYEVNWVMNIMKEFKKVYIPGSHFFKGCFAFKQ